MKYKKKRKEDPSCSNLFLQNKYVLICCKTAPEQSISGNYVSSRDTMKWRSPAALGENLSTGLNILKNPGRSITRRNSWKSCTCNVEISISASLILTVVALKQLKSSSENTGVGATYSNKGASTSHKRLTTVLVENGTTRVAVAQHLPAPTLVFLKQGSWDHIKVLCLRGIFCVRYTRARCMKSHKSVNNPAVEDTESRSRFLSCFIIL